VAEAIVASNLGDVRRWPSTPHSLKQKSSRTTNQRQLDITLAQNSYSTWKENREAECKKRGPFCRQYEQNESVALEKWQEANKVAIVTVPALAGADPLATVLAELGVPAEWANEARIVGWALVLALNGIVLDFGLLLMVARR
jgi:hypothetical protein